MFSPIFLKRVEYKSHMQPTKKSMSKYDVLVFINYVQYELLQ